MSQKFTAYTYDPVNDRFAYRDYTRESLLDECVKRVLYSEFGALLRARSAPSLERRSAALAGILRQILRVGLSDDEHRRIVKRWREWWVEHEGKVFEQLKLVPLR